MSNEYPPPKDCDREDPLTLDHVYELHTAFMEECKVACLKSVSHFRTQRGFAEEELFPKEELEKALDKMTEKVREKFIRNLIIGYQAVRKNLLGQTEKGG